MRRCLIPNFFQPGNEQRSGTATPSDAAQALAKFKAELLGRFLGTLGGTMPSFKDYITGGSAQKSMPGDLGADVPSLIQAMNQPGAFTSHATGTFQPPTPSGMNDLAQGLGLAGMLTQALGIHPLDAIAGILHGVGGPLHILGPNDIGSPTAGQDIQSVGLGGGQTQNFGGGIDPGLQQILNSINSSPSFGQAGYGVMPDSGAGTDWTKLFGG